MHKLCDFRNGEKQFLASTWESLSEAANLNFRGLSKISSKRLVLFAVPGDFWDVEENFLRHESLDQLMGQRNAFSTICRAP